MKRRRLSIILGGATVLLVAAVVIWCLRGPKPLYRVTFLPMMGGVDVWPHAINDSGRVAATVRMPDGTVRVVLWDKSGRTEDLGCFPKGSNVVTVVLNNMGQVACTIYDPNHTWSSLFRDVDGQQSTLGMPGGDATQVTAMNNRGQVVGHWSPARGPRHAFLWDKNSGMQDLGTFGGLESLVCDLNDWGQMVGFFSAGPRGWRAFVYDPNLGMQELGLTNLGLDGTCHINNHGFVVGQFGSAQPGLSVSTWTARTGSQRLPLDGGDFLRISGLNEANRYLVNVHRRGIRVLRRELGERFESHLWESGRHVCLLTGRLCCGENLRREDIEAVGGWNINKDGTILGMLKMKKSDNVRAVLLEPIPEQGAK